MKTSRIVVLAAAGCFLLTFAPAQADPVLQPGDTLYAIDLDVGTTPTPYTGEEVDKVIDGNSGTKYLSNGDNWSGLIVTPGLSTVQSIRFTTANDADSRDPAYYVLYGTMDAISSPAQGTGTSESWTKIASGVLSLPTTRLDSSTVVSFANATGYTSYKLLFPATRSNDTLMQIADVQFYTEAAGGGTAVLSSSNPIIAVDQTGNDGSSRNPTAEGPAALLDGNTATKYLNFGEVNSGIIVVPQSGPSTVIGVQLWTANDAAERDPTGFSLYGMNGAVDPLALNGRGEGAWALIASGSLNLPTERFADGGIVSFSNTTAYDAYRFVVTGVRDSGAANSMQVSGLQLHNNIPEPSVLGLLALGGALMFRRRRR